VVWLRALAAYTAWIGAHAVAGAIFALSAQFIFLTYGLAAEGLAAGAIFGVAQWLVLRHFFSGMKLWAPVTLVASPISWDRGMAFAMATFGLAGWLGGAFSAIAQSTVLVMAFQRDASLVRLSLLYVPAGVIGGAIFYFCYWFAPSNAPFWLIFLGSLGYAVVTGFVIALIAASVYKRSASGTLKPQVGESKA
jgi:hypothetical protein